jgi:hypothetical protein
MPPGAKKSWRFGRFSGGAGVIEIGALVDNGWIAQRLLMVLRHRGFAISIIDRVAKI